MRLWGGRPVDRAQASGAVEQLAQLIQSEPWFWLGLSPEGTRRRTDHLRSGFYHLALTLDLPVALAYIDYARREIGVTRFVHMSGDVERRPRRVARLLRRQSRTPPRKRRHHRLQIRTGAPPPLVPRAGARPPEARAPNQTACDARAPRSGAYIASAIKPACPPRSSAPSRSRTRLRAPTRHGPATKCRRPRQPARSSSCPASTGGRCKHERRSCRR